MDEGLIVELIKELAVGFKAARSYPVGHPVFEKSTATIMSLLNRIFADYPTFSITFPQGAIAFQGQRLEMGKNVVLLALSDNLRKKGINSITFLSNVKQPDVINLCSALTTQPKQLEQYDNLAGLLASKGTTRILINAVPVDTTEAKKAERGTKTFEEIIESIRGLMDIVIEGQAVSESRIPFAGLLKDIEQVPRNDWDSYSEALVGVVDLLPVEKRVALLQDVELRPFVLTLLSRVGTETLVELVTNWERQSKQQHIVKVMGAVDKEKFRQIVPRLKNRQLNVYEYLSNAGINLLMEDDVASTINKEDLKIALQPYYNMLEAQNAEHRAEALRSLIDFTNRLIREKKHDMAEGIVLRIALAIEQEPVDDIIIRFIGDIEELYALLNAHGQKDLCERLVEPFGRILGRTGVSLEMRKEIIKFLGRTGNPAVLPTLFSFLWESGLYPDVRAAIISFGGHAVSEAIQLLRDAEDFSVRMKLVDIMKNIGEPGIQVLLSNVDAREWFLRRNIVRIFGEIGDAAVAVPLERLLKDEDQRVRLELARTYGKLNYKDGLIKALEDQSLQVKSEALRGLKKSIDAEEALGLLPTLNETGDEVYVELLKIIDEKRIFEAIHWTSDLLKRLEWRTDPAANEIKKLGVSALAKLASDNAKVILLDLQNSKDKTLSSLAASALRRIA